MTIEQAIGELEQKYRLPRGKTAMRTHPYYRRAEAINFVPCECSRKDQNYQGPNGDQAYFDFIGCTANGVVLYVGAKRKITVGPKGYHYPHGTACLLTSQ